MLTFQGNYYKTAVEHITSRLMGNEKYGIRKKNNPKKSKKGGEKEIWKKIDYTENTTGKKS